MDRQMTDWVASECETFFGDARVAVTEPCRVSIGDGQISVVAPNSDPAWRYEGREIEPDHFRLWSKTHTGEGTLHRLGNDDILEGGWEEEENGSQSRGMWRITLRHSEDE